MKTRIEKREDKSELASSGAFWYLGTYQGAPNCAGKYSSSGFGPLCMHKESSSKLITWYQDI